MGGEISVFEACHFSIAIVEQFDPVLFQLGASALENHKLSSILSWIIGHSERGTPIKPVVEISWNRECGKDTEIPLQPFRSQTVNIKSEE